MTTQPTSKTLGPCRSAANRPAAPAPGSPSRRALAMLNQRPVVGDPSYRPLNSWSNWRCHRRSSSGAISTVITFFCVSISMMPGGFDCTSLRVGGKPRRVRMRCLGVHTDLAEEQRDRVERPRVDRAAGEFDVHRQIHVIVQRYPIFTGTGCARHGQVAVGNHGPQRRDDASDEVDAIALAIVLHDGLEPFVIGTVNGDLARPFLALREPL